MRDKVARALGAAKLTNLLLAARSRLGSPWLAVLTYHRAANVPEGFPYDPGVIDVTPEELDWQLGFLRERFTFVGLEAVRAFVRGKTLPVNPVLITFDDGYRDNFDTIRPLLKKHGATGTFFIATHYIDERRVFWWDKINYILKTTKKDVVRLTYPGAIELPAGADLRRAIKGALRVVKHSFDLDLDRFLDELAAAADVSLDRAKEKALADELLMTWDEIRQMQAEGMDIQSHTIHHRVLDTLPDAKLRDELAGSREVLKSRLGNPVDSIAYPVTLTLRHHPKLRAAIAAADYTLGFSVHDGVNYKRDLDPLDIRRLAPERTQTRAHFGAMMAIPHLSP